MLLFNIGLLLAAVMVMALDVKKWNDVEKKLAKLERVGVLVTGEHSAKSQADTPPIRMSRRELCREIERRSAVAGG